MFGAPAGAFAGRKGVQSGTESRMSSLIVPLNGIFGISLISLNVAHCIARWTRGLLRNYVTFCEAIASRYAISASRVDAAPGAVVYVSDATRLSTIWPVGNPDL